MPDAQWSRVNETDPSPYDQVFVMSERFINRNFKLMYPNPVPWGRRDREAVRTNDQKGQWIKQAEVEAPHVSIHVEERNPAYQMLFTLPFHRGRFHLRTSGPGAPDSFHEYNISGWKLVFKTRIASKVLSRDDPKYAVYKSSEGFRDSVFELAQLYLDASDVGAGGGFDAGKSYFGGRTLAADTLNNLKSFASEWLNSADERKLNVIGWSLTRQEPSSPRNWVGTFAPAVIDYAPYPWIDPRRPTVETDGLDQNALAILTYTDASRRRGYGSLSSRGAYTDGDAAFCMNRDLFWKHYLLSVLQEINQKTEVFPQKPPPPHQARVQSVQPKYVLGKNRDHGRASDSYFAWKQQATNGQTHWTWQGNRHKAESISRQHQPPWRFNQEATSSTDLSFTPGGKEIHLKGTLMYKIVFDIGLSKPYFIHESKTEWHLPLTLEAVRSGGLQVHAHRPTVTAKTVKVGPQKVHQYNDTVQPVLNGYKKSVTKMLSDQLKPVSAKLGTSLGELHKLFLPGEGVFRFGTPQFNKRGDIIVDLEYSNVHAPTGRYVVNRLQVARDPSDETTSDGASHVEEQDLAAQFEHIARVSGDYPEDRPVSGEDTHSHSGEEEDEGQHPDTFIDIERPDGHQTGEISADHDWDYVERTERPWHEEGDDEFEDDERPQKPDDGRTTYDDFDDEVPPRKQKPDGSPKDGRTTYDEFDDGHTTRDDFEGPPPGALDG